MCARVWGNFNHACESFDVYFVRVAVRRSYVCVCVHARDIWPRVKAFFYMFVLAKAHASCT